MYIYNWIWRRDKLTPISTVKTDFEIYEVFKIKNGKPLFWKEHYSRLNISLSKANIDYSFNEGDLLQALWNVIHSNKISIGNIRLSLIKSNNDYEIVIGFIPHSYPNEMMLENGVKVGTYNFTRENPNIKIANLNVRKIIQSYLDANKLFEVLIINGANIITEGSRTNFFLIKDKTVITSPANTVLEGITRKNTIQILKDLNIRYVEKSISYDDVISSDAQFLTGNSIGILPVSEINSHSYNLPNPLLQKLQSEYDSLTDKSFNQFSWESGHLT